MYGRAVLPFVIHAEATGSVFVSIALADTAVIQRNAAGPTSISTALTARCRTNPRAPRVENAFGRGRRSLVKG